MPLRTSKRVTRSRTRRIGPASSRTVVCGVVFVQGTVSVLSSVPDSVRRSSNLAGRSVPCIAPSLGTADSSARV
ncbi:hypothetical protein FQZ97_665970 [compost metagenome]